MGGRSLRGGPSGSSWEPQTWAPGPSRARGVISYCQSRTRLDQLSIFHQSPSARPTYHQHTNLTAHLNFHPVRVLLTKSESSLLPGSSPTRAQGLTHPATAHQPPHPVASSPSLARSVRMASIQLDHSGSDGSSPHSGEFDDCASSSSGDHSSPSDSVYASPASLAPVWSNEMGFMIQPWSSFDLGQSSLQLGSGSPPSLAKPLAGLEPHQTHQPESAALATDYSSAFDHDGGVGGLAGLNGLEGEVMYSSGMQVEFDEMVHHNQCG